MLAHQKVTKDSIRHAIYRIIQPASINTKCCTKPPYTPRAKVALDMAVKECDKELVTPMHIFLGLITEGEGVAARVLLNLGLNESTVRRGIKQLAQLEGTEKSEDQSTLEHNKSIFVHIKWNGESQQLMEFTDKTSALKHINFMNNQSPYPNKITVIEGHKLELKTILDFSEEA